MNGAALDEKLKLGALVLGQGVWQGQRIIPAAWLDASFSPATEAGNGLGYGYLWYLGQLPASAHGPARWIGGFGNGGQRLRRCRLGQRPGRKQILMLDV